MMTAADWAEVDAYCAETEPFQICLPGEGLMTTEEPPIVNPDPVDTMLDLLVAGVRQAKAWRFQHRGLHLEEIAFRLGWEDVRELRKLLAGAPIRYRFPRKKMQDVFVALQQTVATQIHTPSAVVRIEADKINIVRAIAPKERMEAVS